jgi:hypothetical protein
MGTYSEEIQVHAGKALSELLQENVNYSDSLTIIHD